MNRLLFGVNKMLNLFIVLVLLAGASGCGVIKPKKEKSLSISVPCSIFAAFCEILDAYKKDNPGVKVSFDTGNTIVLMRKVLYKGARPDVYISTGPLEIEPLIKHGLIAAEAKTVLTFDSIILATPATNPKHIQDISDLVRSDVTSIAIPDPSTNSSGKFAVEALKQLNIWEKIKDKVMFTEFGRHTRNYIMEGKIDVGIIYKSCLYEDLKAYDEVVAPKDILVIKDILKETNSQIPSSIAILKTSKNKALAQEFINYMHSGKAQAILKKWEGKEVVNK
ncbi:MAG: molybdate ABC transporter substrate-binding protein [Candidatus Omnitrophica bacterium]|nr:molybdate ABC transporter substrate-binding protein [Candidatus Omnitrophota bacterium]MBU1923971.1 molybdate ABC transporter substrate-binding protein [Candidatus Omnitrophota bacterium]